MEIPAHGLSVAVHGLDISVEREVTRAVAHGLVAAALQRLTVDINGGAVGGIHRSHEDLGAEAVALHQHLGVGHHIGVHLVHAQVLHVNLVHQLVQHLAFGQAHIVLQLGEQGYGGSRGLSLEQILLPVLAFGLGALGHVGVQVAADHLALGLVAQHAHDLLAVLVHAAVQLLALGLLGREHDERGGLQVLLVPDVTHIAVSTVALPDDALLQLLGKVEQVVAHLPHVLALVEPRLGLGGVGLHLVGQLLV